MSHHFAGICVRVTQRDVTVQVDLVIIPDELENSDMEAAGERHAVLRHADGGVFNVWAPREGWTTEAEIVSSKLPSALWLITSSGREPSSLPPLYDDVAESVAAVAGRRCPAHVDYEDQLVFIRPLHEDAHVEDVPSAEHHLPLSVWVAVGGVLIQSHLGDEVSLLGG